MEILEDSVKTVYHGLFFMFNYELICQVIPSLSDAVDPCKTCSYNICIYTPRFIYCLFSSMERKDITAQLFVDVMIFLKYGTLFQQGSYHQRN